MGNASVTGRLLAGAGRARIELEGALPFDGFDVVRHPVCARALVVERGRRACVVSLEATSVRPDLLARLREAAAEESGCEGAFLWVCVTHAFSVPHVRTPEHLADDEERGRNELLANAVVAAVRAAVREAAGSLGPARLSIAFGPLTVNVNRDVETPGGWWLGSNPEGYSDRTVRALSLDGEGGEPIALLFSADVQSSVLDRSVTSDGLRVVSGDLAGYVSGRVERERGGVALFVVGAAGDQAPLERAVTYSVSADGEVSSADAHEEGYRMLHQQGERFSRELLEALRGARELEVDAIDACAREVVCPGQVRADFHALAPRRSYEYVAADPVATTVHALRLGPVVLAGVEPEIASRLGALVRTTSPAAYADVFTLVNGGAKYLPGDEAYERVTYEAMNSSFACGSEAVMAEGIFKTIADLVRREAE